MPVQLVPDGLILLTVWYAKPTFIILYLAIRHASTYPSIAAVPGAGYAEPLPQGTEKWYCKFVEVEY